MVAVDSRKLSREFVGVRYDREFLTKLPEGVDVMGERGEFHTFVYGGPIFKEEIKVKTGEVVFREGFYFIDLLLA